MRGAVGTFWITAIASFAASRMRASEVNPGALIGAVILGATVVAIVAVWDGWSHPDRGFQDRIAGTWLVPR